VETGSFSLFETFRALDIVGAHNLDGMFMFDLEVGVVTDLSADKRGDLIVIGVHGIVFNLLLETIGLGVDGIDLVSLGIFVFVFVMDVIGFLIGVVTLLMDLFVTVRTRLERRITSFSAAIVRLINEFAFAF
jgi:hypothetical protein